MLCYICAGFLAGLTRLVIRNNSKISFRNWWNDGSLGGALIISVTGAVLFDHSLLWAFLGGYFFTYILEAIQKLLKEKGGDAL